MKYDSYKIRMGKQVVSPAEAELMRVLMEFGESIDPHGYDGGDYDRAMEKLVELLDLKARRTDAQD